MSPNLSRTYCMLLLLSNKDKVTIACNRKATLKGFLIIKDFRFVFPGVLRNGLGGSTIIWSTTAQKYFIMFE